MPPTQAEGQLGKSEDDTQVFDARFKLFRTGLMIAMGLFGGAVLGGVVGLFVYANSRTPKAHDGVFALIQSLGVLLGVGLGYLAARSAEAQEQIVEASSRAGMTLLKKYRRKPGTAGHGNVGQRNIGQGNAGEEFLSSLLNKP